VYVCVCMCTCVPAYVRFSVCMCACIRVSVCVYVCEIPTQQRLHLDCIFYYYGHLPTDNREAAFVLLPYCLQNQHRVIADLLSGSSYDVNHCGSRDQRTLLHHCAK